MSNAPPHIPNAFEKALGVPQPKCCSNGDCCKGASPSEPYYRLLRRAAQGDEFARNFFSIMVPYASHEEAAQVVPGLVEKTREAALKSDKFPNGPDDVVFYRCRYLQDNNRCGVHEDRPQFCRDYPDTPFVVMAPGCAFIPWANTCRAKFEAMQTEVASLKERRKALAAIREGVASGQDFALTDDTLMDEPWLAADPVAMENLSLVLSLTNLYVTSPYFSFMIRY